MAGDDSKPARIYDVFISYSRKDRAFAESLETALEAYRAPKSLGVRKDNLRVFRDEADFTGADYQESISKHLADSAKLLVVCSINARASAYVDQEIRLFAETNGARNIISVLLSGIPNNEAGPGRESEAAFPKALSEVLQMPLAVDYRNFTAGRDKVNKGLFYGQWYALLANIYGVSRAEVERREQRRQTRRRRLIAAAVGSIMAALSVALVVTLISRKDALVQRTIAQTERDRALTAADAEKKARDAETQQRKLADERRIEADRQRDIASERAKVALSRQLAAQALTQVNDHYDLALLLSVAAYKTSRTLEARTSLLSVLASNQQVLRYLPGHVSSVRAVAFRPDGKLLATGGCATPAEVFFHECEHGEIRLWDPATGHLIGSPLRAHNGWVTALAFSPDGRNLASGSDDMRILLWDASSSQPIGRLNPCAGQSSCTERIYRLAFSPDGKILASAGQAGATLWDVSRRAPLGGTHFRHREGVESIAFSPNGKALALSGDWGAVGVIDVASRNQIAQLATDGKQRAEYTGLAYSPDGRFLAASKSSDRSIVFWDSSRYELAGEPLKGTGLAFNPRGTTLATSTADGIVQFWDVETRRVIGEPINPHRTSGIANVTFSPSGETLVSSYSDGTALLSAAAPQLRLGRMLSGHTDEVWETAFSPDGKMIASGGADKTVMLWNLSERQPVGKPLVGHQKGVGCLVFSPDGKILASGSADQTILLSDPTKGRILGGPLKDPGAPISSLAFTRSGHTLLAVTTRNPNIFEWDVETRRLIRGPEGSDKGSFDYLNNKTNFSPDGKLLAWTSLAEVFLRDVGRNKNLSPSVRNTQAVSVAFSPDGKLIATGETSGSVTIYDVRTRNATGAPLIGHTDVVNSVDFSPDGTLLASASRDKTVVLWDLAARQPIGRLAGHSAYISSAHFSPDGTEIASAADDHFVIIWDVAAESWMRRACRIANRELTPNEWRHVAGDIPLPKFCAKEVSVISELER